MGIIDFVFAFFIFVLVCLVIVVYAKMARPAKSRNDVNNDKEKRLYKLYQNLEDMMNSIEEYVEEARKDIAQDKEKISELLEKAVQLQKDITAQDVKSAEDTSPKVVKEVVTPNDEPGTKTLRNMKKNDLVWYMKQEGLDDDKIAKELGISRGEVALILGIKK